MKAVDPEHIQIVTGAAEALLALFYLAPRSRARMWFCPIRRSRPIPCLAESLRDRGAALPSARGERLRHRPRRGPPAGRSQHAISAGELSA